MITIRLTMHQTFFSTSFFNFKPRNTSSLASDWIWLYFVVTLGLTVLLVMPYAGIFGDRTRADSIERERTQTANSSVTGATENKTAVLEEQQSSDDVTSRSI